MFAIGDRVRIMVGPLQGATGKVATIGQRSGEFIYTVRLDRMARGGQTVGNSLLDRQLARVES